MTTTSATIGSGRRTRFFLRLARAMPERLRVSGVVTRDPGRADALTTDWGVPAFGTVGDLLRYERPDYIAATVPWAAMPDAMRSGRWSGTGCRCSLRHRPPQICPVFGHCGRTLAGPAWSRWPSSTC